eukprot:CAMPEP_0174825832 /NCGR_PEP_ID=MMETSP1107-20130205/43154_1 /TAXON_ID=36770 /ORGANISM="Paraphysomonas vestita, Strain GFlagA" /LENGTH=112 /DNA_ID=CAMNT_0016057841 /DNA_START=1035 /DNA_END=1370 /DNA_ORIENTATION=-
MITVTTTEVLDPLQSKLDRLNNNNNNNNSENIIQNDIEMAKSTENDDIIKTEQHHLQQLPNKSSQQCDYIRIDIADTGPGITKEQQQSLFREVVQFDDPLSANANGAGLGLW